MRPVFLRPHPGWSLAELLVVLTLVAVSAQAALPTWQRWQERTHAWATRERLVMDLQAARALALQRSHRLALQALQDCAWFHHTPTDWSCGWELIDSDDAQRLRITRLSEPLRVTFTKSKALRIDEHGHLAEVGERWSVQSRQGDSGVALALCLSGGNRLRLVAGATCS